MERVLRGQTGILWDLWNILETSNVLPFNEDKLMVRHGVGLESSKYEHGKIVFMCCLPKS